MLASLQFRRNYTLDAVKSKYVANKQIKSCENYNGLLSASIGNKSSSRSITTWVRLTFIKIMSDPTLGTTALPHPRHHLLPIP